MSTPDTPRTTTVRPNHGRLGPVWIGPDRLGAVCMCGDWIDTYGTDEAARARLDERIEAHAAARSTPPLPVPDHITPEQLVAACDALGLTAEVTAGFNLTLFVGSREVTVVQYERTEGGRTQLVGDRAAMNTYHIPVRADEPQEEE